MVLLMRRVDGSRGAVGTSDWAIIAENFIDT